MSKLKSLSNSISRNLKNQDAFGHPITLSYKDSSTYKSLFGGIVTLFSRIALFAYFLVQVIAVFKRENYNTATSTTYENLSASDKSIILNRTNFDIGFALYRDTNYTYSLDYYEYFSVYFMQSVSTMNQGNFSLNFTLIPGEICQNDRFLGDTDTIENLGIAGYFVCPQKDFQFKLKGQMSNLVGNDVYVIASPCIQEILDSTLPGQNRTCKSLEEIQNVSSQFGFDLVYSQQFFENKNFETPIKSFSRSQTINYQNDIAKTYMLKMFTTNIEFHDSILSNDLNVEQRELYQVDIIDQYQSIQNDPYQAGILINIVVSEKQQEIVRTVDTILTAITNTGGFMSILFVVIQILIGSIQEKMFYQSLINKMYLYHDKLENKQQTKGKKVKKASLNQNQKINQSGLENQDSSNISKDSFVKEDFSDQISEIQQSRKDSQNKLTVSTINNLLEYIQELKRPQFSIWQSISQSFASLQKYLKCKKNTKITINKTDLNFKFKTQLFEEGVKKTKKYLELTSLLHQLQKNKITEKIIFSKHQMRVIPYLQSNILRCNQQEPKSQKILSKLKNSDKLVLNVSLGQLLINSKSQKIDRRLLKYLMPEFLKQNSIVQNLNKISQKESSVFSSIGQQNLGLQDNFVTLKQVKTPKNLSYQTLKSIFTQNTNQTQQDQSFIEEQIMNDGQQDQVISNTLLNELRSSNNYQNGQGQFQDKDEQKQNW